MLSVERTLASFYRCDSDISIGRKRAELMTSFSASSGFCEQLIEAEQIVPPTEQCVPIFMIMP